MLSRANYSITSAIRILSNMGISAAFISPTETGLRKSIIDAHASFRDLLSSHGVHDFSMQPQGPKNKKSLPIVLHSPSGNIKTKISLYRPNSKDGDPRLWISKLPGFCSATDLLAFWVDGDKLLHCVNFSSAATEIELLNTSSDFYNEILGSANSGPSKVVLELLEKLQEISKKGFIETMRDGDTGVGFTLETLLGIQANSSKNPDYKGIELKTKRLSANTRSNLFSQIPDWSLSSCKSGLEILQKVGYVDKNTNRLALRVTVSAKKNPQGIRFVLDTDYTKLEAMLEMPSGKNDQINLWSVELLKERLMHKHSETFWISAKKKVINGKEHFHYTGVTYTRSPMAEYFGPLIESNIITMDYTLHLKENNQTKDHGYLFKIRQDNLDLLFPPPLKFDLLPSK